MDLKNPVPSFKVKLITPDSVKVAAGRAANGYFAVPLGPNIGNDPRHEATQIPLGMKNIQTPFSKRQSGPIKRKKNVSSLKGFFLPGASRYYQYAVPTGL